MANHYKFIYDPKRQGYDTTLWKTLTGTPSIDGSDNLSIDQAEIIHYGDVTRGEVTFSITVPVGPTAGDGRRWGFADAKLGNIIVFQIDEDVFSAVVNNNLYGSVQGTSVTLAWNDSDWTGSVITTKIIWEPGMAKFYINGSHVATISESDTLTMPAGPLSVYIQNENNDVLAISSVVVSSQQYM